MKIDQNVVEIINNIIVKVLCCDNEIVTKDKNMYYDLLADSLAIIDIFISLEETYSIPYTEDDLVRIERVEDIYTFVSENI